MQSLTYQVLGAMGNPGQANYVATKAGIEGLTKSSARELASRGSQCGSTWFHCFGGYDRRTE